MHDTLVQSMHQQAISAVDKDLHEVQHIASTHSLLQTLMQNCDNINSF